MATTTKFFVFLAGMLHVAIFAMESIFFLNEAVYSRFLVKSVEDAQIISLFAHNQGWYNLFLAIAALIGIALAQKLPKHVGATLAVYACVSMLAAAFVLMFSEPALMRAAFIQGIFPALALVLFGLSLKKQTNEH